LKSNQNLLQIKKLPHHTWSLFSDEKPVEESLLEYILQLRHRIMLEWNQTKREKYLKQRRNNLLTEACISLTPKPLPRENNSCFLNTTLQLLFSIPEFREFLKTKFEV